jgi:hypothetical protein
MLLLNKQIVSPELCSSLKELDGFVKQLQGLAPLVLTNTYHLN